MDDMHRNEYDMLANSAPSVVSTSIDQQAQSATPLILVVDDESHICNIVEEYFTIIGYRVIKALSGEAGMKRFMDNNPAIVITDLNINDCNGLDIARKIKQHSPNTKIILISGRPVESLDISNIESHIDYTLQKPIDFSMLASIIRSIVEHDRELL